MQYLSKAIKLDLKCIIIMFEPSVWISFLTWL